MAPNTCKRFTGVSGGILSSSTTVHVIVPLVRAIPTGAKTRPKHLALPPMPIALDLVSGMRRQESPN